MSRQRMENMRDKRSAAAVKGDKKVKRKLKAIKKYDRERAAKYYKKTKAKAGVTN